MADGGAGAHPFPLLTVDQDNDIVDEGGIHQPQQSPLHPRSPTISADAGDIGVISRTRALSSGRWNSSLAAPVVGDGEGSEARGPGMRMKRVGSEPMGLPGSLQARLEAVAREEGLLSAPARRASTGDALRGRMRAVPPVTAMDSSADGSGATSSTTPPPRAFVFDHFVVVGRKFQARRVSGAQGKDMGDAKGAGRSHTGSAPTPPTPTTPTTAPAAAASSSRPSIVFSFSSAHGDSVQSKFLGLESFCYPDAADVEPVSAMKSDHFTFMLTSSEGARTLGFCRRYLPKGRGKRYPEVLCILTRFAWYSLFSQLLETIEGISTSPSDMVSFLESVVHSPFPLPGRTIMVPLPQSVPAAVEELCVLTRPEDDELSTLNIDVLFKHLSVETVLMLFAALLRESRVIVSCSDVGLLSSCVHAAISLVYPFRWQHILVPVLPRPLLHYACAPMPFVIGIHASCMPELQRMPVDRVFFVDLDQGGCAANDELLAFLPQPMVSTLQSRITHLIELMQRAEADEESARIDLALRNAFLLFFIEVMGSYKDFISTDEGGDLALDVDAMVAAQPEGVRTFLHVFEHAQMFEVWVCDRLDVLDTGCTVTTRFERELREYKRRRGKSDLMLGLMPKRDSSPFTSFSRTIKRMFGREEVPAEELVIKNLDTGGTATVHQYLKGVDIDRATSPVPRHTPDE